MLEFWKINQISMQEKENTRLGLAVKLIKTSKPSSILVKIHLFMVISDHLENLLNEWIVKKRFSE